MCGLFGYISTERNTDALLRANKIQSHRGPDSNGIFELTIGQWHVGLAHQRLSIIDLSDAAAQPMISPDNDRALCFNGEIYNYKELMASYKVGSGGDTSVLFDGLYKYGASFCEHLNGMWAFSFIDASKKTLTLSRDRFGEKPLYVFQTLEAMFFASELKTLIDIVPRKFQLNYQVVAEFIGQGLTNFGTESIFREIRQIDPGTTVTFDLSAQTLRGEASRYWTPCLVGIDSDFGSACDELHAILEDSIKLRLRSDVPVGVLLSGGIDSSALASFMKRISPLESFYSLSAVGKTPGLDEREHIKVMTDYLDFKSDIMEIEPGPDQAIKLMQEAIYHNDMPIGDFSNVLHFILMRRARQLGVKVVLSGQGADELFCGYKKYLGFYAQQLNREKKYGELITMLLGFVRQGTVLRQFNMSEGKRYLFSNTKSSIFGERLRDTSPVSIGLGDGMNLRARQLYDLQKTSVPALTHYEDRMSMANGIEIRLPFLDHRLVEFGLKVPDNFKINSGWTKFLLRKAVDNRMPASIAWRKDKQGFLNPQSSWLKKEWEGLVRDHISKDSLCVSSGLINSHAMQKKYDDFLRGRGNVWHREIFSVLSLEIWMRQNKGNISF